MDFWLDFMVNPFDDRHRKVQFWQSRFPLTTVSDKLCRYEAGKDGFYYLNVSGRWQKVANIQKCDRSIVNDLAIKYGLGDGRLQSECHCV
jgi:hypothetical protein